MLSSLDAAAAYGAWMRDDALPFWSTVGLSPDGGVVERLDLGGRPERPGFKRVRVHARQTYVFSHAHLLGAPGVLDAARAAVSFLRAHGRDDDGGWVVKMGEAGGVVDAELDLYDQAFVILALCWWARASGDATAIEDARATFAFIRDRFARPDGQGFLSRRPDRGEALQNPHMHLLEALLALHEVDPDGPAADGCRMLLRLFDKALFDAETGTLGERFAMDWTPADGADGAIVEPGHHYEWYWLLHMAHRAGFAVSAPAAERLFAFAERHGVRQDNALIHDAVDRAGAATSAAHRSWPQTERIKALIIRNEESGEDTGPAIAAALGALTRFYLAPAPTPGAWIDHVDADGRPKVAYVPASTLYHLFLAYAELVRVGAAPAPASPKPQENESR